MAEEKLEVIINAVDNASKVLEGIGGAAKGIFSVGLGVATAAAGLLATGIGIAIHEAMGFQDAFAQTEAVIKSTGGVAGVTAAQVAELGKAMSLVTKFGEEEVMSGENLLLTFTNIGQDIFPQATEIMLDMSAALGQDLKGSAIQLGKALQDPILGVTALRRVGVNFNEEQTKVIKNLVETGKLGEAQALIMKELAAEFGGSAEAAGRTFGGQLVILKNRLMESAETVGMSLLPILGDLMNNVIMPLVPLVESLAEKFGWVITALFDAGAGSLEFKEALSSIFGPEIVDQIMNVVTWFTNLYDTINNLVTNIIVPFVTTHSEAFKGALAGIAIALAALGLIGMILELGVVIGAIASPIGIIIIAAGLLGAAWATNWGGIRDKLTAIWAVLQPVLLQLWTWLQTNIPIAIQALSNFWKNTLMPALTRVWQFLTVDMMPIWKALGELLSVTLGLAITALKGLWEKVLLPALQDVWKFIQDKVVPIFQSMSDKVGGVSGAVQKVVEWIQKMIDLLKNIKLPDWLTPGSPTPFELGLRGIANAMRDVNQQYGNMNMRVSPLRAQALASNSSISNNYYNLDVHSNSRYDNPMNDFNMLKSIVKR